MQWCHGGETEPMENLGVFAQGGMHTQGCAYLGGVHAWGRGHACHARSPLWTEFLTHACENITFPQLLLWMVINYIAICLVKKMCFNLRVFYQTTRDISPGQELLIHYGNQYARYMGILAEYNFSQVTLLISVIKIKQNP